jgi:hypothetical protein
VYVSFRSGPRVAWTSRRVTIQPGETILTDGQNQARTRCGNRIKEVAPAETSKEEPPPEVFDTPLPSRTIPIEPLVGYELLAAEGGLPPFETQDIVLPSVPLLMMQSRVACAGTVRTRQAPAPAPVPGRTWVPGSLTQHVELRESQEERSIRPERFSAGPGSACGRP